MIGIISTISLKYIGQKWITKLMNFTDDLITKQRCFKRQGSI